MVNPQYPISGEPLKFATLTDFPLLLPDGTLVEDLSTNKLYTYDTTSNSYLPVDTSITDHSALSNLSYASSGHTGFQASGDYVTYTGATKDLNMGANNMVANSFVGTSSGTVSRSGGYISSVALSGRTITVTRDTDNYITSITDGTRTWTITRSSGKISSWSVV